MIDLTILNRSRGKSVLLIHGLFTTSGYWLPYLGNLKDCRLLILDIDYRAIGEPGPYLQRVEEIIATEAQGRVDAVVAHSLGALLSSSLSDRMRRTSYEVCPVYGATRLQPERFVEEIEQRLRSTMSGEQIRALLAQVDAALARHVVCNPIQATIYLPETDPYFAYDPGPVGRYFKGNHFDITAAMEEIGKELSA
ncbi:alpha/beta fold hydrolase [Herbaspirillum aquaticum]|jgi:pimeloyl-ACP methyl ester carboxylesterase|uniref:AB hydrolase-1 domain-containing protein n=1 Tax=Herbaspirillum aquaticum TaxID=568783 RepID=A0A225SUF5_9BURK|nr:alpha/beta fold hydrolase [Herbaspirillum aquaticum]OWY34841.1 hypothetical protein CEJ45_11160 [Herbaspirillum aquaticum]